jgi:hypothetical protein
MIMAMNGDLLGTEIATALQAVSGGTIVGTAGEDMWKAVATAVVAHIIKNAEVQTPDTVNGTVTA